MEKLHEPANGTNNRDDISEGEEPKAKVVKISTPSSTRSPYLMFNPVYLTAELTEVLKAQWNDQQKQDFKDSASNAVVFTDPFQICLLPELLPQKDNCKLLVDEMVSKVRWSRKQMDLYEFYQSTDLSNMTECKLLTNFLQLLRRNVRPWLEKITNLKLDYVSASCSMYTCGDYLLVHDDLLKDRQVAFVYYLSPWEGAEQWSMEQGGCLEIFNSDEHCFPHFPVSRKISPKNNQFVFFKVGSRSFHQVGEVTNFDYPRLTINGWFHGASNDDFVADTLRPFAKITFKTPEDGSGRLEQLVDEVYLKEATRKAIQERIENNSETCLYKFFKRTIFEAALNELLTDNKLKWQRQGPANAYNYEILDLSSASTTVAEMISLFSSKEMFALLHDYTDLDLSGENAAAPSYNLEVQRWSHGNYTVLGDGVICEENTLDLIYYLNASDGAGIMTYLAPEDDMPGNLEAISDDIDDSVLLTISPVDNALNIVYRCEGTTKFTKYISHNTPLEKGPVFAISCSYKE